MEFRFNINEFLDKEVSKIDKNLLPDSFAGDRRFAGRSTSVMAEIIDALGHASAKAQGLQHPITTAEKLRNSDYIVYLLSDFKANNGKGTVLGFLKTGRKNLYLFDKKGMSHEKVALCILDFYVWEESQRKGYGRVLYDHMLKEENAKPCDVAIDKPSEKLLAFLYKHYYLQNIIPQSNNFVIYDGFFSYLKKDAADALIKGASEKGDDEVVKANGYESESAHSFQNQQESIMSDEYGFSKYGRHAAHKPGDTMGQIMNSNPQQDVQPSDYSLDEFYQCFRQSTPCDVDSARYDLKYHHSALW